MKVYEFLNVIESLQANVVAGRRGLNKQVSSIEVLEVPEVNNWIVEGTLILTTFYHLKDNPQQQLEIVQKLILNKASALLVNIGQYVESIPPNIINYAEYHGFPIIQIEKEISYDNILRPFYKKRYNNHHVVREVETGKQYDYFYLKNYSSIEDALSDLSATLENPVYIEDHKGRLLFSSSNKFDDGWRKEQTLFSLPYFKHYESILVNWIDTFQNSYYTDFNYSNQRRRVVLPLFSNNFVFALVHLTYEKDETRRDLTVQQLTKIRDKLYIIMMKELLDFQHERIANYEKINNTILSNDACGLLLHFNLIEELIQDDTDIIDYKSILQKYLYKVIQNIPHIEENTIFEREQKYFAFLFLKSRKYYDKESIKSTLASNIENALIPISNISVSPPFQDMNQLNQTLNTVLNTSKVGKQILGIESHTYFYDELGIYEFLITLKENNTVTDFAANVLQPIIDTDDGNLLQTLQFYLNENGNATQAANKLFIHRRTMTYRLKQISSLLNLDLNNAENIFLLQFCLKIYSL